MATTPATTSQIANKPASNAVTVAMDPVSVLRGVV